MLLVSYTSCRFVSINLFIFILKFVSFFVFRILSIWGKKVIARSAGIEMVSFPKVFSLSKVFVTLLSSKKDKRVKFARLLRHLNTPVFSKVIQKQEVYRAQAPALSWAENSKWRLSGPLPAIICLALSLGVCALFSFF